MKRISNQFNETIKLIMAVGILGFLNCGCSVVMATKQPTKKNLSVLNQGTPRSFVIAELGVPISSKKNKNGFCVDAFSIKQGYSKAERVSRAFAHGVADVMTVGIWEVAGTPMELVFNGTEIRVQVTYNEAEEVVSVLRMDLDGQSLPKKPGFTPDSVSSAQEGNQEGPPKTSPRQDTQEKSPTAAKKQSAPKSVEGSESTPTPGAKLGRGSTAESRLQPSGSATAFAITENGYFITNNHAVEGAAKILLKTTIGVLGATVIKQDKVHDLALLKANGRFPALPIDLSRSARLGASVATVGFPNPLLQGFAPKLSKGEIASISGVKDDARQFQVSIPVQKGNSGGPVVDELGNVIGVIQSKLSPKAALAETGLLPENVNYAIKSSFLLSFLEASPEVYSKLKEKNTNPKKFEEMVEDVVKSTAMVVTF